MNLNLSVQPISLSGPQQAFPAKCNVTLYLIMPFVSYESKGVVYTVPDVPTCFYNLKTIKCQVKVNDGPQLTPKFAYFTPKSCIGSNLLVNNLKKYVFLLFPISELWMKKLFVAWKTCWCPCHKTFCPLSLTMVEK
jgi:hypothetical protein